MLIHTSTIIETDLVSGGKVSFEGTLGAVARVMSCERDARLKQQKKLALALSPSHRKLLRGVRFGFSSTHLTAALRKKTALLFVNQASALAGKGHFSTQPPKCYANY